ncbi:Uu.00g088690.m01.CDS01 [Anthostomella pinea]|uniref:Uu.00g088690.m01.CDS01 n=1 Tax=Anthostomella pinea TaxID=933095 RepID=A0AAI8YK87_9PEZI|nr:Uu.00g088690.m01.CDS01 [Anthostomella pinea]
MTAGQMAVQANDLRDCSGISVSTKRSSGPTMPFIVRHVCQQTMISIFKLSPILRSNPDITRHGLSQQIQSTDNSMPYMAIASLIDRSINIMTMVDCSSIYQSSGRLGRSDVGFRWNDNTPFAQFLEQAFPRRNHSVLSFPSDAAYSRFRNELRADRLKDRLGLSFRATSNLRDHLKFDRQSNILQIYYYTSFLKEQLRLTKSAPRDMDMPASLKFSKGALPRQLMLETLDSVQGMLFPLTRTKPWRLLGPLIEGNEQWDADVKNYDHVEFRRPDEQQIPFYYLAERLSELRNEMEDPMPRGWLEQKIKERSSDRHMMTATLVGVVFAVFLGALSLAVSAYQAWIAYQAWKHPINPSK